jgi:hypothetical protein
MRNAAKLYRRTCCGIQMNLAIRILPFGKTPEGRRKYAYQLINTVTLRTIRQLTESQAEAMRSELIPIVQIEAPQ